MKPINVDILRGTVEKAIIPSIAYLMSFAVPHFDSPFSLSCTSYGMNSYSIGIEMVHVGGQDYPEAQLNAVDKVIAYIDTYYGKQSTIIDHKDWRPSNSDTDSKFATYLANYKSTRHH